MNEGLTVTAENKEPPAPTEPTQSREALTGSGGEFRKGVDAFAPPPADTPAPTAPQALAGPPSSTPAPVDAQGGDDE